MINEKFCNRCEKVVYCSKILWRMYACTQKKILRDNKRAKQAKLLLFPLINSFVTQHFVLFWRVWLNCMADRNTNFVYAMIN